MPLPPPPQVPGPPPSLPTRGDPHGGPATRGHRAPIFGSRFPQCSEPGRGLRAAPHAGLRPQGERGAPRSTAQPPQTGKRCPPPRPSGRARLLWGVYVISYFILFKIFYFFPNYFYLIFYFILICIFIYFIFFSLFFIFFYFNFKFILLSNPSPWHWRGARALPGRSTIPSWDGSRLERTHHPPPTPLSPPHPGLGMSPGWGILGAGREAASAVG